MVVPHSGGYPHAKFEGNLLLFKFGPLTKSGLTIPQCEWQQHAPDALNVEASPVSSHLERRKSVQGFSHRTYFKESFTKIRFIY